MATQGENSPRQLPNGRWMEEVSDQEGLCLIEKVLGTRLKSNNRYWLIQFKAYNRLVWVIEEGCRCDKAIKTFLSQMPWDHPPDVPDMEYLHPTLLQQFSPAAPQIAPQPAVVTPQVPPHVAPVVAPKKKVTFMNTDQVFLFSGLEEEAEEEESQNEDEKSNTAPKKRSFAEASTISVPMASRGRGNKSKPFYDPQKANALHARTARCEQDPSATVPPKPRKHTPAEKAKDEEAADTSEAEDAENPDEGEQAKKASQKRAYADSSTAPGPSSSGGSKKPMLFNFIPNPTTALTVNMARSAKDDIANAAVPQLKLSAAAAATAITNIIPTMHGAATAAVASPTQPQQPYGLQQGLKLIAILDVRHEAGRTLAEVRYDDGAKELVPTALLAQHEAEARMLNAYYEDRDKTKTSGK